MWKKEQISEIPKTFQRLVATGLAITSSFSFTMTGNQAGIAIGKLIIEPNSRINHDLIYGLLTIAQINTDLLNAQTVVEKIVDPIIVTSFGLTGLALGFVAGLIVNEKIRKHLGELRRERVAVRPDEAIIKDASSQGPISKR